MIDALRAGGPHPKLGTALMLFGQFVGAWDLRVWFFDQSGHVTYDDRGQWLFGWVLDGRTVQDVLIFADPETGSSSPGERRTGTTVRHLDPDSGTWAVVWVGAVSGAVQVSSARAVGDEIWVEAAEEDGSTVRAVFTGIETDRFRWQALISADGGINWRMEQEIIAARRVS